MAGVVAETLNPRHMSGSLYDTHRFFIVLLHRAVKRFSKSFYGQERGRSVEMIHLAACFVKQRSQNARQIIVGHAAGALDGSALTKQARQMQDRCQLAP